MKIDEINNWEDWCRSFQDIEVFKEMIFQIFDQHNLTFDKIENTFPGTNAVFKVGKYIIKIFVPERIKTWDEDDYSLELKNALNNEKISTYTSKLIGYGYIKKRLLWNYLIFEYVEGKHMYEVMGQLHYKEKEMVVNHLKQFLLSFNVKPIEPYDNTYIIKRIIKGKRWNFLKSDVKKALFNYIKNIDISKSLIVHGDITGDNVLINDNGIVIIDFGDSCIAPYYYEYAPIILDLFKFDKNCIDLFYDGDINDLVEVTIQSIFIHDFGGDFAFNLLEDKEISSLNELKDSLRKEIIERINASE
jgi:serine/threonine protein kinase